jgi:predicted RNA binding protein YcfA (HicA-like mRNA interferase family)
MSRLPSITPKQMVTALKKAGFTEHHQEGSHLYLWHAARDILTSVPMHRRDLQRTTMFKIIKQTALTQEEFRKLL